MNSTAKPECPNCPQLQARVAALEAELAQSREQLAAAKKNSATSSKPPSSDIVKPKPTTEAGAPKLSIGGQPGHPKHERDPFPPEQITHFEHHTLDACPCCGGPVRRNGDIARVVQQVDIQKPPQAVEQHTSPEFWCSRCQKGYCAPMPTPIQRGGLVGPELTTLIAFMKGCSHASFSTVRTFLRDVVEVTISRGELCKIIDKVSQALERPYEELLLNLPKEDILNVDETGHSASGARWWTWCFRAELYTLYHIDAHRSANVLMDLLGKEFKGILGCDYFSAYRRYMRECSVRLQFCLAHLIRDVKFLTTLPDERDRRYGEELRAALKNLFDVFHLREQLAKEVFQSRLEAARDRVLQVGLSAPPTQHGNNLAKRFRNHGAAYFAFVTTPDVEPTNNLAEQAIRFVVIDRHITQGTRSDTGRRFCERIWTVIATCAQQGRSVYTFLRAAVESWFHDAPAPSLVPATG